MGDLNKLEIDACFPRSPAEQAAFAWEKMCAFSPLIAAAKGVNDVDYKQACVMGGYFATDRTLLAISNKPKETVEGHFLMKLQSLALHFENACVHGTQTKTMKWAPLKFSNNRTEDCVKTIGNERIGCDYPLHRYDDRGRAINSPGTDEDERLLTRWQRWTPVLPFYFELESCVRKDEGGFLVGWAINWVLWRAV
jgi:hypothetical protein